MSITNVMAVGVWVAFLSVMAIVGIIVAGGFIVALVGKLLLNLFDGAKQDDMQTGESTYNINYNTSNNFNANQEYVMQSDEKKEVKEQNSVPANDYQYEEIDDKKAKEEKDALEKEPVEEDDFFKNFNGDNDERFNDDDDLMSMVDEISQDVLADEETEQTKQEEDKSKENKSVLDKYSIDDYFNEDEEDEIEEYPEQVTEENSTVENVVDEETMNEINELKQQVKEIVESMEENRNQNETFNEQLIKILNELTEANKKGKEVETKEDAENEIDLLKKQLEEARLEIESQVKEAKMQDELKEQLDASNAEIESLKQQLNELKERLTAPTEEEPDEEPAKEVELPKEDSEIASLREEVKEMLNSMREESNAKNNEFNTQLLEILNEMKSATLRQSEKVDVETTEDAIDEIDAWKEDLENSQKELERQFKEELANKDEESKAKLQEQMDSYNSEISNLKAQLTDLMEAFKQSNEESKAETQNLIEQLEAERKERIRLEQERVNENNEQLEALRKENEELMRKLANIRVEKYEPLTEEESDDLYAEVPNDSRKLEQAKQEVDQLKEQVERMTAVMEGGEAEKPVQEEKEEDAETLEKIKELAEEVKDSQVPVVRSPLFDVELIKKITAQEVEEKVQERLAEAMKEIEEMKKQLEISKQEVEKQYKEEIQKGEEIEVELKAKLQDSAAEIIALKEQLSDLTEQIEVEHQEAKENSEAIVEQLEQDRKEKEELTKQQLQIEDVNSNNNNVEESPVTVVGPKNNQVALVTNTAVLTESVEHYEENIPTIDINTVKKLAEQEIEEKVEQRMTSSIVEIQELKKQILNLSIQVQELKKEEPSDDDDEKPITLHYSSEQAYLERIAILEERLKVAKKDFKINAKELNPLEKVNRTLERDKIKLRRREAIVAKKKVALYGVNNYVDIDKEKEEKLAQELELLDGLRISVQHCEEVMNANIDRYPILVHTNKILKENISNIESDLEQLNKELAIFRANNGSNENN